MYNPLWATPSCLVVYFWKVRPSPSTARRSRPLRPCPRLPLTPLCPLRCCQDANFHWRPAYEKWRSREYWTFILPSSLFSVWMVWLPAVTIIYCLPGGLQIPLFAIVVCFWSIILTLIAKASDANDADPIPLPTSPTVVVPPPALALSAATAPVHALLQPEGIDEADEEVELAEVDDSSASESR